MDFVQIIQLIITIVAGFLSWYFKRSEKAQAKAAEIQDMRATLYKKSNQYISEAEEKYADYTNMGNTKFSEVVNRLYALVPQALRGVISKEAVAEIVQNSFDEIQNFAAVQLDKALDKIGKN